MPKETSKKQGKEKKQENEKKHFMKDFKAELKRVIWPTPKQLLNSTVAVITIVLITAVIVFALDFAFEKINHYGIDGIKSLVEKSNKVDENSQNDSENNSNEQSSNEEANSEVSNEQNTDTKSSNEAN